MVAALLNALVSCLAAVQAIQVATGGMDLTAPGLAAASARVGHAPLTRREREVAALVARGLTNRQIAQELVISAATADRHVVNILNKLGYRSRAQVAAWYQAAQAPGALATGAR